MREVHGGDVLHFAMAAAKRSTDATDEEMDALREAIQSERQHSPWPAGFFPDF